ncbi:MAG: hypothetical protein JG781_1681 [Peptococcaceae bacterium]|uniref:DUF4363 family protein n=1 Tax=Thermanaerosceptrum fracticalcis TaxID=1712410 RepID=A0A7G6DZM4_THEFR|nr:hypothetical protein [Thermanaerosceptrum fracticalcis]MBZ4654340.1 hypothetical protein [Peptococcaceae bacterium]QNB45278.1 hypothetical protein BR63_02490 [Thermanaerosceptrum fracticalcis]
MRKITKVFLLLFLFSFAFVGCDSQVLEKPDLMEKLINKTVETTEKAIKDKDIKLAREIWGQVSDYGLKANETGKKELSESLGKLASTYLYLVKYLETGDAAQLNQFRTDFETAIQNLKSITIENKKV